MKRLIIICMELRFAVLTTGMLGRSDIGELGEWGDGEAGIWMHG